MEIIYELWSDDTGNLIAEYASEEAALAAIRAMVHEVGADALADLSLAADEASPDGDMQIIARGADLIALALRQPAGAAD